MESVVRAVSMDEEAHHDAMVAKVASAFVLGLSALTCSCVPFCLIRKCSSSSTGKISTTAQKTMDMLLRFGGGILIATTFLHLLPEVREGTEELVETHAFPTWPVAIPELVMCIGFFIMYFVEECAHICLMKGGNHGEGHSHAISGTPLRGILIVIALSVHQIFEGLAVGLEEGDSKTVWMVTSAIAAHKLVIAVCVGAEMAFARTNTLTRAICIATFAIATPLGIAIGIGLWSGNADNDVTTGCVSVILQGLATGTLLYVVFFEVLSNTKEESNFLQFFATAVGFVLMLILVIFFKS
ncbi:zinc transporter ZIP3-like [Cimex lectularius]|uniref:Uncharacterized protein n=1 Tax=Cimex lectularius TaxID=79782 RepID=A0A8I6RUZ1_CIMLE|nr:zinc transporter ZIP3-like [Cimex lectularius]